MEKKKEIKVLLITARADNGGGPRHIASLMACNQHVTFYGAAPRQLPYYPVFQQHCRECIVMPFRKFSPGAFLRLVKLIWKEGIDVIHSHGTGGGIYGRLLRLFYPRGICVHTFHGIHDKGRGVRRIIYLLLEKILGRLTHQYIFVSRSEKERAQGFGIRPVNCSVILNGVDTGYYQSLSVDVEEKKKELGIGPGKTVIGTVGRLSYPKAPEIGIRAISLLKKDKRNVVYIMAGDGEEGDRVREEIERLGLQDSVLLLGDRADVGEILKVMDIFVLPSRWEGLPLALLEAMASGIPVVASRVTGNIEAVLEGATGMLVEPESPEELFRAITLLLDNPDLRRDMGVRGQKTAAENFDHVRMARETFKIYQSMLKRSL